ncbi:uncharacterized protein SPPG_04793 [Spizellomyces punctatus DAOM BR117]|uniref:Aminoglycoside phosphotransferase domain-containing protein n=1 Tax=Spizellomyces punctatus (strain DAOM BR117) TaxID=645134 RepID=A0A0L0HHC9_SPIPD|nr:uncharacterized protein SPPG_04793 [Spizellomyces punctatus DAOM BR117]KND00477.1 hypothetical protein SPPG_04793 [Spizellomyces punctatus DAOM BR117]|eukprot:XP_016608516.1 hypothetical protein SPPG_04793 [Spizellomyces punctatus DAOM BR117]
MRNTADLDLTTDAGILSYLVTTLPADFPRAVEVTRLSGGHANFVWRVKFAGTMEDGKNTAIVKHAEPFLADDRDVLLGTIRMKYEYEIYTLFANRSPLLPYLPEDGPIHVPKIFHYDPATPVLLVQDIGVHLDLKTFFSTHKPSDDEAVAMGRALGTFLVDFHSKAADTESKAKLMEPFENEQARMIIQAAVHDRVGTILAGVNSLSADTLQAATESAKAFGAELMESRETLIMGDFWPGNIIVESDATGRYLGKLWIVDWEVCRYGLRAMDVGQFSAEAYLLSHFRNPVARSMLTAFHRAYVTGFLKGKPEGLRRTFMRQVSVQFGSHIVAWAEFAGWTKDQQKLEEILKVAATYIENATEQDNWESGELAELADFLHSTDN